MADLTVEITTSRAISAQLLRHKSFSFQEFSQRYSAVLPSFEVVGARSQDLTNRQSSHDDLDKYTKDWFTAVQEDLFQHSFSLYEEALRKGIAKECARNLLPMASPTRLYMKGNIRSWMTYLNTRLDKSTQLEHRKVAESIHKIMANYYPICASLINKE
jgi:thymidylate synthase (FAD)